MIIIKVGNPQDKKWYSLGYVSVENVGDDIALQTKCDIATVQIKEDTAANMPNIAKNLHAF